MKGYIDSIETMGLVDGPGIRMVVFTRGCKLRCLYCHNPETWNQLGSTVITSDEVVEKAKKNMSYYRHGGVTFSGGEPLLQPDFLIDCLKKMKEIGLHTALDTAGVGIGKYEEILRYTDLVILDIKAIHEEDYKTITGHSMDDFNEFIEVVRRLEKPLWIRQVIVPRMNDTEKNILELKEFIKQFSKVEKVELLPYHLYGVEKYKKLNMLYPLEGVPAMDNEKIKELTSLLES